MSNNNNPDLLYLPSRETLLLLEDTRLYYILQSVANYYSTRNDQPMWGSLLRFIAQEMARLDYDFQYDIVSKEPQFLTPPDIKRRFADPLHISSVYPYNDQFDKGNFTGYSQLRNPVGYRDMLVDLIAAYGEGAIPKSLSDIVFAYTGKTVLVEELFKEVGNGVFDQSDRNTVRVAVNVGGNNPLTNIQNLAQLQEVVQSLYGALDLAKPAHVGLAFTTIFGEFENIALTITDTLRILIPQVETSPQVESSSLDPMLWIAPIFNVKHPKTTLAAYGRVLPVTLTPSQWQALQAVPVGWDPVTTFPRGVLVNLSTISPPFAGYQIYRSLKSNTNQPPASSPAYWKPLPSPSTWQGYTLQANGNYMLGIPFWSAGGNFFTGQLLLDPNGNLQVATQGGVAGGSVTFSSVKGNFTHDGGIIWLCLGANYLIDPSKWIQIVDSTGNPTGEVSNWNISSPQGLVAPQDSAPLGGNLKIKSDTLSIYNLD